MSKHRCDSWLSWLKSICRDWMVDWQLVFGEHPFAGMTWLYSVLRTFSLWISDLINILMNALNLYCFLMSILSFLAADLGFNCSHGIALITLRNHSIYWLNTVVHTFTVYAVEIKYSWVNKSPKWNGFIWSAFQFNKPMVYTFAESTWISFSRN